MGHVAPRCLSSSLNGCAAREGRGPGGRGSPETVAEGTQQGPDGAGREGGRRPHGSEACSTSVDCSTAPGGGPRGADLGLRTCRPETPGPRLGASEYAPFRGDGDQVIGRLGYEGNICIWGAGRKVFGGILSPNCL